MESRSSYSITFEPDRCMYFIPPDRFDVCIGVQIIVDMANAC
jgi:hypothetical protein